MAKLINKQTDIKYVGRDFDAFKQGLIEFTKAYYPNTYNDFNEASPGSLFLDMAAYVGDVLSYYTDYNFRENFLVYAQEKKNLLTMAAAFGYKPKLSVPASVTLDVYQLLPPTGTGATTAPDFSYGLKVKEGMEAQAPDQGISFITTTNLDFTENSPQSPTEISVYSYDTGTGAINYYLAKKQVKAISAKTKTKTLTIGASTRYLKLLLEDTTDPLIGIQSIVDSDNNIWYEVPYLAQDTMFERVQNTIFNDPASSVYSSETPWLMKLKKVPRRFIVRVTEAGLEIQFGAGISSNPDEELLATPEQIGLILPNGKQDTDASLDPSNPLITSTYGLVPSNTTLTITYLVGGGVSSNVPSNAITSIISIDTSETSLPLATATLNNAILQSVAINNLEAASGGRNEETIEEIRQNTLAQFSSQNRAVTREDYIMRVYSMPTTFGSAAKAYITPDEQQNIGTSDLTDTVANPLALNLYVLGYDNNKNCTTLNGAVKENLKTYLSQYRMLTDSINIRNAYVINIGVKFDIIPLPNFNANEVLLKAIQAVKDYFNIDRWQIAQPIVVSDVYNLLFNVDGVQSVSTLKVMNLNDSALGYSDVVYDVNAATRSGIVYPSLDPAIFEVKFPNIDIQGRITNY
jgi:hypothetical protein